MDHQAIKSDKVFMDWKDTCARLWQEFWKIAQVNIVFDPSMEDAYKTYQEGITPEQYIERYKKWYSL